MSLELGMHRMNTVAPIWMQAVCAHRALNVMVVAYSYFNVRSKAKLKQRDGLSQMCSSCIRVIVDGFGVKA